MTDAPLAERRRFLLGAMAAGLSTGLGLTPMAARAGGNYSYLPPGYWPRAIKNDEGEVDYRLIAAFENIYFRDYGELNNVYDILLRKFGITNRQVFITTPAEQPAYWFAIVKFNYEYQRNDLDGMMIYRNLMKKFGVKKDSAMYHVTWGMDGYIRSRSSKYSQDPEETNEELRKAILKSMNLEDREDELIKAIETLDKDAPIIKELHKRYAKANLVNLKIATWESFFYSNNETVWGGKTNNEDHEKRDCL